MAGVLSFDQYIGGPDQIKIKQVFPKDQTIFQYDFNQDITGWTFELDQQTLIVDEMTFNRNTGQPNFATSKVIGFFPKTEITTGNVNVQAISEGIVHVTIPQNLYTGPIIPDARLNVPITIVALTWSDGGTPAQINTHRWGLIQCWEPDVTPGDPTSDVNYTALGV